jgi:intracellular multiplication protein IcmC
MDIPQILINLNKTYPYLWKLVTGVAFVAGIVFALRSIYAFKVYGEARTMMNPQTSLRAPVMFLFIAACLLYTPTGFQMVMHTIYGYSNPEPLRYSDTATDDMRHAVEAALRLIQLIGIIAFVRGWFHLSKHSHQGGGGGQHSIAKAMTHIFGGIMAVNIMGTYHMFTHTLGINSLF